MPTLSHESMNAYVSELPSLAILLAIWKYLEGISRFSNCHQRRRAQMTAFMKIFSPDLTAVHSETLMDIAIASELEGESSIENLDTSSMHTKKQLELIAVMTGSSVMHCVRASISGCDAVLKYICRNLSECADAPYFRECKELGVQ